MNPQDQINQMRKELDALAQEVHTNNFSSSQDFNKYSRFNSRLKVPRYTNAPATGTIGDIIEVSGKLQICSSANVWTIVGLQS